MRAASQLHSADYHYPGDSISLADLSGNTRRRRLDQHARYRLFVAILRGNAPLVRLIDSGASDAVPAERTEMAGRHLRAAVVGTTLFQSMIRCQLFGHQCLSFAYVRHEIRGYTDE